MPKLIFDKMPVGISPDMVDLDKDNWCVFDIETNGLLPEVRVVHCIVIETPHGIERYSKFDKPVELGIQRLNQFEILIGHNISGYDLPALLKMGLYDKPIMMCDTHISAKVAFPKPDSKKFVEWYDRLVPERHGNLWDNNGLKSWGCRIGEYKGNFGESTDWQECTEEMVDYCEQDVKVNTLLFKKLREEHSRMWKPLRKAIKLETECNWFFAIMAIHGFRINANKAYTLAKDIESSITKLKTELPWHRVKVVKRLNKDGTPIGLKINSTVMNVNSNGVNGDWAWLFKVLGKPQPTIREFDKSTRQYVDKPTASAKVLVDLDLPEITPAIDLIAANKAYSTIRKGAKSILTSYESSPYQDNRIHTEMSTTGTETYRCNHKCYDSETEVFTDRGWVLFTDLTTTDKVAAVRKDGSFEYEIPKAIHTYNYDGILLGVESKELDYRVTPNHLMYVSRRTKGGWKPYELLPQEELVSGYGSCYRVKTTTHLPNTGDTEDNLLGSLLGFVIGDGYLSRNRYRLRLKRTRKIEYVVNLLKNLNIPYRTSVYNDGVYSISFDKKYLPFSVYDENKLKHIDDNVFNKTTEFKQGVWDGLKNSDGSTKRKATVFSSTSYPLIVQTQRLLTELGYYASNLTKRTTCYTLMVRSGRLNPIVNSGQIASNVEGFQYKGTVHCVTVSTGLLLTRRNGKQLVSGNSPNVNFPKVKKDKETKDFVRGFKGGWGVEFREIVEAPDGWSILGADAKGLEFRMLGHSTHQFDNGALLDIIMNACIHTASAELYTSIRKEFGIHEECSRDEGKGVSYGYMYGGGADKLGRMNKGGKALGERLRERLAQMWNLTALLEHLGSFNDKYKHIKSIDGRLIPVKSAHSLLNYLLQSSGGIVCKAVVIQFVRNMLKARYVYGDDFEVWLFVHDELQVAVRDELIEPVGKILLDSFEEVGKFYKLQCPLEGDLKVGKSWADTH